ncbi:MAG: hypothetical protein R2844_09565 [Caldilineales bacterium]
MNSFSISMDTIHVVTQRAVKLNTYSVQSNQWVGLTVNETLELMQERYPDMTDEDEFYINFFYPFWQQGNTSIIAVDGEDIAPDAPTTRRSWNSRTQERQYGWRVQ